MSKYLYLYITVHFVILYSLLFVGVREYNNTVKPAVSIVTSGFETIKGSLDNLNTTRDELVSSIDNVIETISNVNKLPETINRRLSEEIGNLTLSLRESIKKEIKEKLNNLTSSLDIKLTIITSLLRNITRKI